MDVDGHHYESFDDLVVYCRRVAGGIGRLCLAIFGCATATPARSRAEAPRRRSRRGAAADEHPARRARGRRERPRLPAGRGPGALRPASMTPTREPPRNPARAGARRRSRARAPARGSRRRARAARRWCASSASARANGSTAGSRWRRCSTGAAQRACWRWPASTDGCSSASRRSPKRALRERMSLPAREKAWVAAARHARSRRLSATRRVLVIVGGGLAGIAAALDCADGGRERDAGRGAGGGSVERPTRSSATACSSTTASTCSCAAAPPTARCSRASAASS